MILDTNALIDLEKGRPAIVELLRDVQISLNVVAVAEFRCGLPQAKARSKGQTFIDLMTGHYPVLGVSAGTARHYAEIWNELRVAGTPLPTNDIWIAALAREHGLPVVTRDAHFKKVKGLKVVAWEAA